MRTIDMIKVLRTAIIGGVSFWLPDLALHALSPDLDPGGVLVITMALPIATLWAYLRLDPAGTRMASGFARAWLMLVGIWLLGPTFMMASATLGGSGFQTWNHAQWLMLVNPGVTFIMATYDGALGALILVTVGLPVVALIRKRRLSTGRTGEAAA